MLIGLDWFRFYDYDKESYVSRTGISHGRNNCLIVQGRPYTMGKAI
jgi:hypothetical protein